MPLLNIRHKGRGYRLDVPENGTLDDIRSLFPSSYRTLLPPYTYSFEYVDSGGTLDAVTCNSEVQRLWRIGFLPEGELEAIRVSDDWGHIDGIEDADENAGFIKVKRNGILYKIPVSNPTSLTLSAVLEKVRNVCELSVSFILTYIHNGKPWVLGPSKAELSMVLGHVIFEVEVIYGDQNIDAKSVVDKQEAVKNVVRKAAVVEPDALTAIETAVPKHPPEETTTPTIWDRLSWAVRPRTFSLPTTAPPSTESIGPATEQLRAPVATKSACAPHKVLTTQKPTPSPPPPKPIAPALPPNDDDDETNFTSSLQPHPDWRCNDGFEVHDFFISYRVATDASLATELALALRTSTVHTYLDKYCLIPGQKWEDGFLQGLLRAKVVLLVCSVAALQRVLIADKTADNMLLEWEITLDMVDQGLAVAMPLFVGTMTKDANNKTAVLPFDGWGLAYPDKHHVHKSSPRNRTIKQTMQAIFALQGKNVSPLDVVGAVQPLRELLESTHGQSHPLTESEVTALKDYLHPLDMNSDRDRLRAQYTKGTRKGILNDLLSVRHSRHKVTDSRVTWLKGEKGVGKSVIAAQFMDALEGRSQLGGAFICRHDDMKNRTPMAVINTLTYQLAMWRPSIGRFILDTLKSDETVRFGSVKMKWEQCVIKALSSLERTPEALVFVIDGLDECGRSSFRPDLLSLFTDTERPHYQTPSLWSKLPSFVSVIVTARPEDDIAAALTKAAKLEMSTSHGSNEADIEKTIRARVAQVESEWNEAEVVKMIVDRAAGVYRVAMRLTDEVLDTRKNLASGFDVAGLVRGLEIEDSKWVEAVLAKSLGLKCGDHDLLLATVMLDPSMSLETMTTFTPISRDGLEILLKAAAQIEDDAYEIKPGQTQIPSYLNITKYIPIQRWDQDICGTAYPLKSIVSVDSIECTSCHAKNWWGITYSCEGCNNTYAGFGNPRSEYVMLCPWCGGSTGMGALSHGEHERNVLLHPQLDRGALVKSIGVSASKYIATTIPFNSSNIEPHLHRRMTVYCLRVLHKHLPNITKSTDLTHLPPDLRYAAYHTFTHWKLSANDTTNDIALEAELNDGMRELFSRLFVKLVIVYSALEGWQELYRHVGIVTMTPQFWALRNLLEWLDLNGGTNTLRATFRDIASIDTNPVVFNTPSITRAEIQQLLEHFCHRTDTDIRFDHDTGSRRLLLTNPFKWAKSWNPAGSSARSGDSDDSPPPAPPPPPSPPTRIS
ncbi:hypothetical protein HDV00_008365 [Rhizophlyctis rosea]|nr:hypothetical protein HDV00_008365 [Rhizophlyctis rosea]